MQNEKPHIEKTTNGGRAVIRLDAGEAEMTWRDGAAGQMIVDHTFTPPAARGQGVAARLADAVVAEAREAGRKIRPICPYMVDQMRDNAEEWSDVAA